MSDSLLIIAPALAAVLSGVLALLFDALARPRAAVAATIIGLLGAAGLAFVASRSVEGGTVAYGVFIGGGELSVIGIPVFALAAASMAGGAGYLARYDRGPAMGALVAIGAAAASALAASSDLVMTAIALETLAICGYALVAAGDSKSSSEAAMKYLIQGAVATGLLVLALAVLFGLYGGSRTYAAVGLSLPLGPEAPAALAASLMLAVFAFKLGAAPFHAWAPDVFEAAPRPAAAFLAGAPKLAALFALFVVVAQVFEASVVDYSYQVAVLAVFSIALGNLAALKQTSFTRMLGYSGIAQVGYALSGLAAGLAGGEGGVAAMLRLTLVLMIAYAVAVTAAFLLAHLIAERRPEWDGTISGMAGVGTQHPLLGIALGAVMFSLTGIPLTAGFWGKLLVFGVLAATPGWLWLSVVAIVASVISFGYYGSVLRSAFFDSSVAQAAVSVPDEPLDAPAEESRSTREPMGAAVVLALALLLLLGGIVPLFSGLDSILALIAG